MRRARAVNECGEERWRRVLVGVALVGLVVGASRGIAETDNADLEPPGPAVGALAPDFALTPLRFYDFRLDEREITRQNAWELYEPVRLGDFRNKWPVALVFGSSASVLRADARALEALHRSYADRVQFLFVYIREVRPPPGAEAPRDPETDLERMRIANAFVGRMGLSIACVVDAMDDAAMKIYAAEPARLYVVEKEGGIAFASDPTTAGLDLGAFEAALVSATASPR